MVESILDKLKIYDDDECFAFDPIKHKYTYNGESFISVTQFISLLHREFDTEYWSKYKSEQLGKPQEDIKKDWKEINERANFVGTSIHDWIENYFNKKYQELPTDIDVIDRINKFNIAYCKYLYKLMPIKFEQRIFSKKYKIAGMLDSLFLYKDKIIMIDWKSNKAFYDDSHNKGTFEKLLSPFDEFWKNHHNDYSIQVSLYRLILSEIGVDVKACYLLHIPPDGEAKIYTAKDFTQILKKHLDLLQ